MCQVPNPSACNAKAVAGRLNARPDATCPSFLTHLKDHLHRHPRLGSGGRSAPVVLGHSDDDALLLKMMQRQALRAATSGRCSYSGGGSGLGPATSHGYGDGYAPAQQQQQQQGVAVGGGFRSLSLSDQLPPVLNMLGQHVQPHAWQRSLDGACSYAPAQQQEQQQQQQQQQAAGGLLPAPGGSGPGPVMQTLLGAMLTLKGAGASTAQEEAEAGYDQM